MDAPVGHLWFGNENAYSEDVYAVCTRNEFQIGRADIEGMLHINDVTISSKHISIRCVQFDEDATWGVPPIVYVEDLSLNGVHLVRTYTGEDGRDFKRKEELGRARGSIPFLHGDRLYLSQCTGVFVQLDMKENASYPPLASLMAREVKVFEQEYCVTPRTIGIGGHGKVYAAIHQATQHSLACKVVPLLGADLLSLRTEPMSHLDGARDEDGPTQATSAARQHVLTASLDKKLHRLAIEHDILKDLDHPNIVTVQRVFVMTHHIYILQELITGGDLLSFMAYKHERPGDAQSAVIILQVLRAVDYLHDHGIVHRDIKPDNILVTSWKPDARVVLTDFGHAKRIGSIHDYSAPQRMFSTVGTVGYTAPEIRRQNITIPRDSGYSSAVDIWSVGVITAVLLTGHSIFTGNSCDAAVEWDSERAKLVAAAQCDLSMIDRNEGEWSSVKRRGKLFVKSLLVLDEKKRLTAKQALQDPWLNCPTYVTALEALYERAISGWRPRHSTQGIVHYIDTSYISASSPLPSSSVRTSPVKSAFFDNHASVIEPPSSQQAHDLSFNMQDPYGYNHGGQAAATSPELGESCTQRGNSCPELRAQPKIHQYSPASSISEL